GQLKASVAAGRGRDLERGGGSPCKRLPARNRPERRTGLAAPPACPRTSQRLPGCVSEYRRGPLQGLEVVAGPAVLAAQLYQFPPVRAAQCAPAANVGIRYGLDGPAADRLLSRGGVLRRATRSVVAPASPDDLGLQLPDGPVPALAAVRHVGGPPTRRPGGIVAGKLRADGCPGLG